MDFLTYMQQKLADSPQESVAELMQKSGGARNLHLIYVDILKGFCEQGALSSDRVNLMVKPVAALTEQLLAQKLPAENIVFLNDAHPENAVEFSGFPAHCVKGTAEAEVVDVLKPVQQTPGVHTFYKNATNGLFGKNDAGLRFFEHLERIFAKGTSTFVVVGDCTDLCIYQNALGIRLFANEQNADVDVVLPISHVETYDMSIENANEFGVYAHDADFLDTVFLYHMQANGVRVVKSIVG